MKRTSAIAAVTAAALALSLAACGSADSAAASSAPAESTAASTEAASSEAPASEAAPAGDFDADQDITVISREDGSGTRGSAPHTKRAFPRSMSRCGWPVPAPRKAAF